jgi:peptide/nickel transport system substrate-binding protein
MFGWYSGKNGSNIAQKSNQWQGQNFQRWINKDYDTLYESLVKETDAEKASAMLIQMNDLIIHDVALIPEVNRAADSYAIANTLNNDNIMVGPGFELDYWNIANWTKA